MKVTFSALRQGRRRSAEVRLHVGRQSVAWVIGRAPHVVAVGWDVSGHGGARYFPTK